MYMGIKVFYAQWKESEHRFNEPLPYDFSFKVEFPNIVLRAKSLQEASSKIKMINHKIVKSDRFSLSQSKILSLAI